MISMVMQLLYSVSMATFNWLWNLYKCQTLPSGCPQITVTLAATFVLKELSQYVEVTLSNNSLVTSLFNHPWQPIFQQWRSRYLVIQNEAVLERSILSLVFVGLAVAWPHALQQNLTRFLGEKVCIQLYCFSYRL